MQAETINKTALAMRLGLILAFCYVVRDLMSFGAGDGILSIVVLYVSMFFFVFPFIFLYRATVNYCIHYNDCKYVFSAPFSISIKGYAFAGIIYTFWFYLYVRFFDPDMMVDIVDSYEKLSEGQGQDEFIKHLKEVAATATPKSLIPSTYLAFLLMGFFVSFVSVGAARFAKLQKPVDDKTVENKDN